MPNRFGFVDIQSVITREIEEGTDIYVLEKSVTNAIKSSENTSFMIGLKVNANDPEVYQFTINTKFTSDEDSPSADIKYEPNPEDRSAIINFINWDLVNTASMHDVVTGKQIIAHADSGIDMCVDFILRFINDDDKNIILTINLYSHSQILK